MKNINQLKKEIEEKRKELHIDIPEEENLYNSLNELKAQLKQLEKVCEEVEKKVKKYDKEDWRSISFGMKELLKKFKGDEK